MCHHGNHKVAGRIPRERPAFTFPGTTMVSDQYGECWLTRIDDPDGGTQLRVDRADPVVRISPQLLADIPPPGSDHPATFDGKVLRIHGVNRTVAYRIRDVLEPRPGTIGCWDYIGEWSD